MKYLVIISVLIMAVGMAQAHESPEANVRHSMYYEWMVHHNAAFRHARMRKECGPLRNDEELLRDCIDSFYR